MFCRHTCIHQILFASMCKEFIFIKVFTIQLQIHPYSNQIKFILLFSHMEKGSKYTLY
jgi:hypothetical protein